MAIHVPTIIELIALRPKIRTVEIADIVDCDPDHVQPALQNWINAGDIIVHQVTAPNGKPANGFECTDKFKKSELHGIIMTRIQAKDSDCQKPQLAQNRKLTPMLEPEKSDLPILGTEKAKTVIPVFTKTKRKSELGLDCIKENGGKATNHQLRRALGIAGNQYPSTWMHLDVRAGKVHFDGEFWRLGRQPTGKPVAPEMGIPASKAPETATEAVNSVPNPGKIETFANSPAPVLLDMDPVNQHRLPTAEAPTATAPAARAAYDPERYTQEFACAVWSNGGIQVRRFGIDVAIFAPEEVKLLRKFVNSMLAAA